MKMVEKKREKLQIGKTTFIFLFKIFLFSFLVISFQFTWISLIRSQVDVN